MEPISSRRRKTGSMKLQAAPLVFAAIIGLGIGLVIGWLAKTSHEPLTAHQQRLLRTSERLATDLFEEDPDGIIEKIIAAVDTEEIKTHLKRVSTIPHLSGTVDDHKQKMLIYDYLVSCGLDDVQIVPYNVILSLADSKKPNTVELVSKDSQETLYQSTLPLLPERKDWIDYPYPYFSYGPNGTVIGEPVFVNYGTDLDYDLLKSKYNISVNGKIVIVKSGSTSCGKKLLYAEKNGAIGLLIYPDPKNFAQGGTNDEDVYPNSWWLPKDGIVRASLLDSVGDPSTPGYPSINGSYRHKEEKMQLPKIIAQPINYQDAKEILGRMGGPMAPSHWQGDLDIVYHIGPGFSEEFQSIKLKIRSFNQLSYENIYNIIGTINGETEPDRYVMIGNHRDAWVAGTVDPGSGTAVVMELARIFGSFVSTGASGGGIVNILGRDSWRPKRTIKLGFWGAEEYGLIGSTEWVEDNILELQERVVSYINVDTCVFGDTFFPMMSSSLTNAMIKVTKLVPDPQVKSQPMYDNWWKSMKTFERIDETGELRLQNLGVFSDFAPFAFYAGIPVIDVSWQALNVTDVSLYPAYHTSYETTYYVEKFLDPGYRTHATCAQFSALMTYLLSDSAIIPFNFTDIVKEVTYFWEFAASYDDVLAEKNISFSYVNEAVRKLKKAAKTWEANLQKVDKHDPFVVRAINDHQLLIHKAFWNRDIDVKKDAWFFRHDIEGHILSIVDKVEVDENVAMDTDSIERQLGTILLLLDQLTKLLSVDFSKVSSLTNKDE